MEDHEIKPGTEIGRVPIHTCRCGHRWIARDALEPNPERPSVCPLCKSPRWDRERRWTRASKEQASD